MGAVFNMHGSWRKFFDSESDALLFDAGLGNGAPLLVYRRIPANTGSVRRATLARVRSASFRAAQAMRWPKSPSPDTQFRAIEIGLDQRSQP